VEFKDLIKPVYLIFYMLMSTKLQANSWVFGVYHGYSNETYSIKVRLATREKDLD